VATEDDNLLPVSEDDLMMKPLVALPIFDEDVDEPKKEEKEKTKEPSEFDSRYKEPFLGLLYIGELTKEVMILGHGFFLKTPTQRERLEAGLLHKKYLNSISAEISWASITTALYLHQVDGYDLPLPIGPKDSGLQGRLDWVLDNIKSTVTQLVFEECLLLDVDVSNVLAELERLGEA
jgi:hypothetical protein